MTNMKTIDNNSRLSDDIFVWWPITGCTL